MRRLTEADYSDLCEMLCDDDVMYAYEGAFSPEEARSWLDNQLRRYADDGRGLYAVILKETGGLIGQCGLTTQDWRDRRLPEIGYLFKKTVWHMGYATEAASAWRERAFTELKLDRVYSIIRDTNTASQNVALRNGMTPVDTWVKHYRGVIMPHILYCAARA